MKRALLFAAALLACAPAFAGELFLWSVQGPKATHYLAGSVHMLPASAYPLPGSLDEAYLDAEDVVFESDLSALSTPDLQAQMLGSAREQREGGLPAHLKPELYKRMRKYAAQIGLPEESCDAFRAWFCALTLEQFSLQSAGFEAQYGLDQHFFARAADDNKAVAWLESPQFQVQLLTGLDDTLGAELLAATLEGETGATEAPAEMLRIWNEGDAAVLEKQLLEIRKHHPQIYARLYADRNRTWLPDLGRRFRGERHALVIVGIDHLLGPDGLVKRLSAEGFKVKRVAASAPVLAAPPAADAAAPR